MAVVPLPRARAMKDTDAPRRDISWPTVRHDPMGHAFRDPYRNLLPPSLNLRWTPAGENRRTAIPDILQEGAEEAEGSTFAFLAVQCRNPGKTPEPMQT